MKKRAADWRVGPVVYQVFVDRFAPPRDLEAKRGLYGPHAALKRWDELPKKGGRVSGSNVWAQEVEFWGGDLRGLREKLGYLKGLGVDAVYMNPIFYSMTNHKYDAWDFRRVDPAYGTRAELAGLTREAHALGMRVILDGVFNHMGSGSEMFREAMRDPKSPWRDFFLFDEAREMGYVGWCDHANLPEINLEGAAARKYFMEGRDSIVQSYILEEGIDGWRLDVAHDLGFELLAKITASAHAAKADSVTIGEIWNYPEEWFGPVDGVMNMHLRAVVMNMLEGKISPDEASRMTERMVEDCGIENVLRSWVVIDNHDVPRLRHTVRDMKMRKAARALQFTLPGAPCVYYGSEAGMEGGADPYQRAPMRWDLATETNPEFAAFRGLMKIRSAEPALRYGDYRRLHAEGLFAFLRRTDRVSETLIVIFNPGRPAREACVQIRDSRLQDFTAARDLISGASFQIHSGMMEAKVPGRTAMILKPSTSALPGGYSRYDRFD